jgi:hypothetical protein
MGRVKKCTVTMSLLVSLNVPDSTESVCDILDASVTETSNRYHKINGDGDCTILLRDRRPHKTDVSVYDITIS